ncbi:30S ribosomal protein S5 [archaeon]|nr:30S ribosomal protein S5 [archaeon]
MLQALERWVPKTEIGKQVKAKTITNFGDVVNTGKPILEQEIVDSLLPELSVELLNVGQSKGKFGGGKKSIWKQTQKKTNEGNKPTFAAMAAVGNREGYVGLGYGKAKETMPAREKATRMAKLNLISVRRGCGSWACGCKHAHSVPFTVEGKSGSVIIRLMPAPRGTSLKVNKECQTMLELAGIKDVYSKTKGKTSTKINLIMACFNALKELNAMKLNETQLKELKIVEKANT